MQSVIGAYSSERQAAQAVRQLERHMSIQDIVIVNKRIVAWRKLHPNDCGPQHLAPDANFFVVMIGAHDTIERARALLLNPARVGAERVRGETRGCDIQA